VARDLGSLARRVRALDRPVDPAGLALFRILFGALLAVGMIRLLASGLIERLFGPGRFHFAYAGFGWVVAPPLPVTVALIAALAVLALGIALGLCYRASAALFFVGFAYLELIDVTNYLNHYYLVALLVLLCACLPLDATWSLDARRRPARARAALPAWMLHLVRLQVGVVYLYAGLAKLNADWLLHAQPLATWLTARVDTPLIGGWLGAPWLHLAASWAAFLFDTTIVGWLLWRRTRPVAYLVLLGFHAGTHLFFNIGLFPFIMSLAALVFFPPSWPRRFVARGATPAPTPALTRTPSWCLALAAAYTGFQLLFPLRHYAYPGDVAWNEEGMRWSWKVLLREKHGSVTFYVRSPDRGVDLEVPPSRYLDVRQEREMAGQPDLILQLAHHIAADLERQGHRGVEVRADARVSWNGRAPAPLVDPTRDLARVTDSLAPADWISPAPSAPPPSPGFR
jgi:hypothetical protein